MARPHLLSSDNASSSSPAPPIFCDQAAAPPSPPSSPPGFPWDYDTSIKTSPKPPVKTAFSVLGKRKALEPTSDNVRPVKKAATAKSSAPKAALTQMQISLGQEVQKRCGTCGMEYIASSAEDRKLHDKYHKQNTRGYEMGKIFTSNCDEGTIWQGVKEEDVIVMVDWRQQWARKAKAQDVLEIVQRELGAVEIDKESIWKVKATQYEQRIAIRAGVELSAFKSYLYVRKKRCIGFLLVEKIERAWEVIRPAKTVPSSGTKPSQGGLNAAAALKRRREAAEEEERQAKSAHIELSTTDRPASLGVSRIWTSPTHRRQKIAIALLNAALDDHLRGAGGGVAGRLSSAPRTVEDVSGPQARHEVSKSMVAFSQPTTSGAQLARKWFGKLYGWSVYFD